MAMALPSPDEVPVSIEPVLGWRAWTLRRVDGELRLSSLVHSGGWWPQRTVPARCAAYPTPRAHTAPAEGCSCGYYATDSWESLCAANVFGHSVAVVGPIAMWGMVVQHGRGARSEFAYPARLRLVCGPCLKLRVVRDPVLVVDSGGSLSPRCGRHAGSLPGVPAAGVQAELLDTYAVELLPKPSIPLPRRIGIPPGTKVPAPAQIGLWAATAIFRVIGFLITAMFVLWMVGLALVIISAIVGGAYRLVTGQAGDASPTATPTLEASAASPFIYHVELKLHGGVEPHRGVPRTPPPPNIALTCGVGHGDQVEFVDCADPRVDLFGFGEQSDPQGVTKDCFEPNDAYSSGPHWYACWFAPGHDTWIDASPTSPNPFVHPLGGALH